MSADRKVIVSPGTHKLSDEWVHRQTESFFEQVAAKGLKAELIMRDNDRNYSHGFDQVVKDRGARIRLTAIHAPNENPYVERLIGSIRRECLNHVIVLNERHLTRILADYFDYYHRFRMHLILDGNAPNPREIEPPERGMVIAVAQVGGLHHRYMRVAA